MGERVIEATRWTAAFRPSSAVPGMFVVQPEYWDDLREAIDDLSVPSSGWGGMYSSFGSTWAFLDGGVHYIDSDGYGMTTLHTGWRVLGWQVMRVLCELFDLTPPRRLKGEAELRDPADLIQQLRATAPDDAVLQERAELLASASTGADMREIAARSLGGDADSTSTRRIGRPRLVEVRRATWGVSRGYLADINFIFRVFVGDDGHEELLHDGTDLKELALAEVVGIAEVPELCLGSIRRWIRHLGGVESG